MGKATERYNRDGPECPYCGHVETIDEAFYYDETGFDIECGNCAKHYQCAPHSSWSWTSNAKEQP